MPVVRFFDRPISVPVIHLIEPHTGYVDTRALGQRGRGPEHAIVHRERLSGAANSRPMWFIVGFYAGDAATAAARFRRTRPRCGLCGQHDLAELCADADGGRLCFRCAAERIAWTDTNFSVGG